MANYTLTLLDTAGIQSYVFGGNRIKENVGASALVEKATQVWPLEIVRDVATRHNITADARGEPVIDDKPQLERDGLDAEVLYVGGGNTVTLFAGKDMAKRFAALYSERLLARAPGLEAAVVHVPLRWNDRERGLRAALRQAWAKMAVNKATRPRPTPVLGLGVTATCESTGFPAADYDPFFLKWAPAAEKRYRSLSAETLAKLDPDLQEWSQQRLHALIPAFGAEETDFEFWYDFNRSDPTLTEEGTGAYLAVVHADGNDMGQRFQEITNSAKIADDRTAVSMLRSLSNLVNRSGAAALAACGDALAGAWSPRDKTLAGRITLGEEGVMPFRPLVYGGDDITLVCDGRLGLALAVCILEAFETETERLLAEQRGLSDLLPKHLRSCHACAGVAVVKAHYPFARAYQLSANLCGNAKEVVRRTKPEDGPSYSALDWHFATGSLYGSIKTIRDREYTTPDGALTMRPLRLHDSADTWQTWPRFARIVRSFQNDPAWAGKRNKVIQLRQALRDGPLSVERYRSAFRLDSLPALDARMNQLQTQGWYGCCCGYFDAIEALDFYLPL